MKLRRTLLTTLALTSGASASSSSFSSLSSASESTFFLYTESAAASPPVGSFVSLAAAPQLLLEVLVREHETAVQLGMPTATTTSVSQTAGHNLCGAAPQLCAAGEVDYEQEGQFTEHGNDLGAAVAAVTTARNAGGGGSGGGGGDGDGGGGGGASEQCIPTMTAGTAAEGETLTLRCSGGGVIKAVVFASFGTPTGNGGGGSSGDGSSGGGADFGIDGSCHASSSQRVVAAACLDSGSCTLQASAAAFESQDPCPGTQGKRLAVLVNCAPAPGTCGEPPRAEQPASGGGDGGDGGDGDGGGGGGAEPAELRPGLRVSRAQLADFYARHAPEKLHELDEFLRIFTPSQLLAGMLKKYGRCPKPSGALGEMVSSAEELEQLVGGGGGGGGGGGSDGGSSGGGGGGGAGRQQRAAQRDDEGDQQGDGGSQAKAAKDKAHVGGTDKAEGAAPSEKSVKRKADRAATRAKRKAREEAEKAEKAERKRAKQADLDVRKDKAKAARKKFEDEAAACPAVLSEAGEVLGFGGGGKSSKSSKKNKPTKPFKDASCAHRRAGKLTGKERTAQKVARMDYTDKMAAANTGSGEAGGPVRKNKKHALRMAKRRAKAAYREENMAVFDMYGRLLKYGLEPLEVECKFAAGAADGKAPPACKVTKEERRKFRTKEEEIRQKQIVADRQATMDTAQGSEDPNKKRQKRMEKENRARCKVYKEWAKEWKRDGDKAKQTFFEFLTGAHEDFAAMRTMWRNRQPGPNRAMQRKVKKLYRHIALAVHPDKLPHEEKLYGGKSKKKRVMSMMRDILTEADRMKDELTQ